MIYVYHRYFFAPGEKTFARANQKVLGGSSISEAGGREREMWRCFKNKLGLTGAAAAVRLVTQGTHRGKEEPSFGSQISSKTKHKYNETSSLGLTKS